MAAVASMRSIIPYHLHRSWCLVSPVRGEYIPRGKARTRSKLSPGAVRDPAISRILFLYSALADSRTFRFTLFTLF